MAAQNKLFQRLIWLIDTIHSAGHISRAEIDHRWTHSVYNDMNESSYGERNFYRHRDTIYELFGIEILCNRSTKEYYIRSLGDAETDGVRSWLINTFAIKNMVNLAGDMKNHIIFEQIPEGARYLTVIISAIKKKQQLQVTYQGFERTEPHTFLLAPYCLRVFKQRWYMVGKPADHPEEREPRVYALDRVKQIVGTQTPFIFPQSFNPKKYFDGCFGVDRSRWKIKDIRIKTGAMTANFIRTLPLHVSQKELDTTEEYSIFSFRLSPTYDFIQELRKHGPYLEVLEPQELREQFSQDLQQAAELYKK